MSENHLDNLLMSRDTRSTPDVSAKHIRMKQFQLLLFKTAFLVQLYNSYYETSLYIIIQINTIL
jgi:hypothetical protein